MSVLIYTDPHLGLKRQANTTNLSQARWRVKMYQAAGNPIVDFGLPAVCAGDLFDTYNNDELTIGQGLSLIGSTDWVIAGNHDVSQIADKVGSLELIESLMGDKILRANFGDYGFDCKDIGKVRFYGVPHVAAQELFDRSLDEALADVRGCALREKKVLLLHCNYDNNFAAQDDTSLNLTREKAKQLLKHFDYIVLGHEHVAREDFDGRLIVLGNTFPTGFGDISDKRVMVINDEGKVEFHTIWRKDEGYAEFGAGEIPDSTDVEFVKITGTIKSSQIGEVSRQATKLWKTSPNLLALKLAVELEGGQAANGEEAAKRSLERLPDIIARELDGTDMWNLWKELVDGRRSEAA